MRRLGLGLLLTLATLALREFQQLDADGSGTAEPAEADRFADDACTDAADALAVEVGVTAAAQLG